MVSRQDQSQGADARCDLSLDEEALSAHRSFRAQWTARRAMMKSTLLTVLLLMPVAAVAQQPATGTSEPVVVASGQGVVLAVPDRAWITISAESRASSPREAQRLNTQAMNPVLDKLKAAGIP